jgi:hypothetical protein
MRMHIDTLEGIVKNGQVQFLGQGTLPENTKVYVIVQKPDPAGVARIRSPRLAHPEQADEFRKQVIEIPPDAEV